MSDLRADLKADLLADLTTPEPPAPEPAPVAPVAEHTEVTPAVSFEVTPLRWSRPRVVSTGLGKAVRVGPLSVGLSLKQ